MPGGSERMVGKNEAACAADAAREVVERWLPDGDRLRKAYGCRNPTSFSPVAHFCRMKRLSPTRILRASRRASSLCVLTHNKTPFSTSSERPPRAPVRSRRLLPCSAAQSPRHSTPLSPPIQSP
jgi:hypothetical protein